MVFEAIGRNDSRHDIHQGSSMRCLIVKRPSGRFSQKPYLQAIVRVSSSCRWRRPQTPLMSTFRCVGMLAILFTTVSLPMLATAADEPDYSSELPRVQPLSAEEAIDAFQVAPGFRIELVVAEPMVFDPVAISYDEHGRMYVVEMRGYSEQANDNLGRIACLEDSDGDGRYDSRHVLVDKLSWPTAIICYDGGVFVGAAPDIWYFKDTNSDHKADLQKRVFTGFGKSNVQGLLNSFRWGLDNRIHGATSSSGGSVVRVDENDQAVGEPLALRRRDFAFDPESLVMTAESGGGQHGMSFDDFGTKYVCSNSDHLQQVMFEDRYVARNRYAAAPSPRQMIAADGPQADVFRASPVEPWRIVRTRLRVAGAVNGPVEGGGKPAGYFTGSTGVTVFRGIGTTDPATNLLGTAIIGDVGSNLVHRKRLTRNGLSVVGSRIDANSELLRSTDIWFRPVQFANGPDGCLHIIDMYREVIEHPKSLPPMIKKHLDLTSGRDRGRIWRLIPSEVQEPASRSLATRSPRQLVGALASPIGWVRETASRVIATKKPTAAIGPLVNTVLQQQSKVAAVHALHLLDTLNGLDANSLMSALNSDAAEVRAAAVRLAESPRFRRGVGSEKALLEHPLVHEKLLSLANDADAQVRYQLAFTLGELDGRRRREAMVAIATNENHNRWVQLALQSSSTDIATELLGHLSVDDSVAAETRELWIETLSQQIRTRNDASEIDSAMVLLRRLASDEDSVAIARTIGASLSNGASVELQRQVAEAMNGSNSNWLSEQLQSAQATIESSVTTPLQKVAAIEKLSLGSFAFTKEVANHLLVADQPAQIQDAVIRVVSSFRDGDSAKWLIERRAQLGPSQQRLIDDALWSHQSSAATFLRALDRGDVERATVSSEAIRRFTKYPDKAIADLANRLVDVPTSHDLKTLIASYSREIDSVEGNATAGATMFQKHCAVCHRVGQLGKAIGPNLLAASARGRNFLLTNILDPNREVDPAFQTYAIVLHDGRVMSGVISAETATSLTVGDNKGEQTTVLRHDIDTLQRTGRSLMPEGLEKQLSPSDLANLFAWLNQ